MGKKSSDSNYVSQTSGSNVNFFTIYQTNIETNLSAVMKNKAIVINNSTLVPSTTLPTTK